MSFYPTLTEAVFRLDLRSPDVDGAVRELAGELASSLGAEGPDSILAELERRERLRKVAGEGEFALLHVVTPRVRRLGLAFGRSPSGLSPGGGETTPVHFVCLALIPPRERSMGFRVINGLAAFLRDPMVRTQLLWAETHQEALAICRQGSGPRWFALASWFKERAAAALRPSAASGAKGESA